MLHAVKADKYRLVAGQAYFTSWPLQREKSGKSLQKSSFALLMYSHQQTTSSTPFFCCCCFSIFEANERLPGLASGLLPLSYERHEFEGKVSQWAKPWQQTVVFQ